jgi:hypothetical protein
VKSGIPEVTAERAIVTDECGFGFSAVREDYDGAPDSHCPIGIGMTREAAIAALLEQESTRD